MLRFQLLPVIQLRVGTLTLEIVQRSRGSLTGSRTAGAASRIPVESSVLECAPALSNKGFDIGHVRLTFATYVDNIFSASATAAGAVGLLDELAAHLKTHWHLDIKNTSRDVMVVQGGDTHGGRLLFWNAWAI